MVGSGTNQSKDIAGRRNSKLQAAARRVLGGTTTSTTSRAKKLHLPEGVQCRTRGTTEVERCQRDHTPAQQLRYSQGGGDRTAAPGAGRRSPGAGSRRADRPERGRRPAVRKEGMDKHPMKRQHTEAHRSQAPVAPRSRTGAALNLDRACCQDGT
jgi:hypothetical protein